MKSYTFTLALLFSTFLSFAQPAPDFTITGTDNLQHRLYADYLNQGKTVVLKLMFVACPPCNQIAPATQTLYEEWGEGAGDVEFISLSIFTSDSNSEVLGYEQMHSLTYPGAGADGGGFNATIPYQNGTYGTFYGTPTFVVIAPNGSVNFDVAGAGQAGTIIALDAAIEATGATRPGSEVFYDISGKLKNESGQGIGKVQVAVNDQFSPILTGANGQFAFQDLSSSTLVDIAPVKNINHRNGITTFDIVNIQKHILSIEPLNSPYKIIAADINHSNSVTTFDIVQLRKLILLIDTAFTDNTSWRFVPSNYVFPNPAKPFDNPFPESIQIDPLNQDYANLNFTGIKIGDMTGNADPNALVGSESRNAGELAFNVVEQKFEAGDVLSVPFYSSDFQDIIAFQFTLDFDKNLLDFMGLENADAAQKVQFSNEHIGLSHVNEGAITVSWNDIVGIDLPEGEAAFNLFFKARQKGKLSKSLQISSSLTLAEAFTSAGLSKSIVLQTPSKKQLTEVQPSLHPNTIQNEAALSFTLKDAADVQLEIIASNGQFIQQRSLGKLDGGEYELPVNFQAMANGVYFLRFFENGRKVMTLSFVMAK